MGVGSGGRFSLRATLVTHLRDRSHTADEMRVFQLCVLQLVSEAWLLLQAHRRSPFQHWIAPDSSNTAACALTGAWRRARYLLLDAYKKPTWLPPNTESFNSLLKGMVHSMDPGKWDNRNNADNTDNKDNTDRDNRGRDKKDNHVSVDGGDVFHGFRQVHEGSSKGLQLEGGGGSEGL